MNKREYKWPIKMVQDRYPQLKLTFEQAEKVHQFEKDKEVYSDEFIFSFWEEMDCELDAFQRILTPEQLLIYKNTRREMIASHEQELLASDERHSKELEFVQELLAAYKEILLPKLYILRRLYNLSDERSVRVKMDLLLEEYKQWWLEQKKGIIVGHYRYKRVFSPNQLQSKLLNHEIIRIFPSFFAFEYKMDKPTKAVAAFISEKLRDKISKYKNVLNHTLGEIENITKKLVEKHFDGAEKSGQKGWHITIIPTPEQAKAEFLMSLLLMENETSLFQPPE